MDAANAPAFLRTEPAARILLVEDDPDLAAELDALFRRYGFETEVVRTRTAALQRAASADLVVLDLALPDGDGSQVVDWFRQRDRLHRVALVVYTARDLREDERDRLHLGPTEHLTKARIPPEEVRRRVLRLLERVVPAGQRHAA
jgi:DNA-binding response OmpR family regulator